MYRVFRALVVFNVACLVLIPEAPGQDDASSSGGAVAARAADAIPNARWEANAQAGVVPGIISSDPPSGSIDARQPSEPGNPAMRWGWDSIDLVFDGDTASMTPADFAIVVTDGAAPTVSGVVSNGPALTLLFDGPIPPGAWTTVTHLASATSVQLGFLPGDVNGDGYAGSLDLLTLVDAINGVGNARPLWSTDMDRSGGVDELDITACTELLGTPGTSGSWNGRSLPGAQNSPNAPGAGASQAIIELVPALPGPYPPNSMLTVDVWIQNQTPNDVLLRLVQFDSSDTNPNLVLPQSFTFDLSTLDSPGLYVSFPSFPLPSTVFFGLSAIPGRILVLPGNGSLHIGQIQDLALPAVSGVYLLDVINADEPDLNRGAIISFGFGVDPYDPVTFWRGYTGELAGGRLVIEVTDCPDIDGDGVCDSDDPCPVDNPDDSDGDGVCDSDDICPGGDDAVDTDGDGVPDFCDACPLDNSDDFDGDGVCDSEDICQGGDDRVDTDGDAVPDFCDPCPVDPSDDSDGDGVCDSDDLCPGLDDRVDADGNGIPDCLSAIPTVSQWGLVVLTLFLLTTWKLQFGRRLSRAR